MYTIVMWKFLFLLFGIPGIFGSLLFIGLKYWICLDCGGGSGLGWGSGLFIYHLFTKYKQIIHRQKMLQKQPDEQVTEKSLSILKIAKENNVAKLRDSSNAQSLAPFTMVLQPFKVNENQFQKLFEYSKLWQKITNLASLDADFILSCLDHLSSDPMIGPMLNIFKEVTSKPKVQVSAPSTSISHKNCSKSKPKILLFRTDFFITDDKPSQIKLIEYNNMSVSMAGISQQFQQCQKKLWGNQKDIIENKSTSTFSHSLAQFYKCSNLDGILLVVVMRRQTNIVDQQLLFNAIQSESQIKIQKVFLEDLAKEISVGEDNNLFFKKKKVAMVYYRAGYSSNENIDWQGIRKCNLSNAVNIPSISQFLIGTKKMQAELSKKKNMLKYLSEPETNLLLQSVIDTWDFEEQDSKEKILAMIDEQGHDNFVLKPNEQGGRHNLFGEQAYIKIGELNRQQLLSYILTRKIKSRIQPSTLIRSQEWDHPQIKCCDIESEISIYGCVCSVSGCDCEQNCKCCSSECFYNCCEGYLVRCKPEGVNEGGLMAGTGAICGLELVKNL